MAENMPDEFTPEEKKHLAESPADSATLIGDDTTDDTGAADDATQASGTRPPDRTADEEPPAGAQA